MPTETTHQAAVIAEDLVRYERVKKKGNYLSTYSSFYPSRLIISNLFPGYVRLLTNFGALNLELHCDLVSKTCENFIKLCQRGYYNGTKFHRSIRNFMVNIINVLYRNYKR